MDTIDFNDIPESWVLCQNRQCLKAGQCLRYQACLQTPQHLDRWKCLLPNALGEEPCKFFQNAEKVTMARGLYSIYQQVDEKKDTLRHPTPAYFLFRQQRIILSLQGR